MLGIGKRELMEDYYFDELAQVVEAWNDLHRPQQEEAEEVHPLEFFGGGGEFL